MINNLFNEGLILMSLGMGFVFVFLIFLVGATKILSKILSTFYKEQPNNVKPKNNPKFKNKLENNDDELVAVIASVLHHRKIN